jgi:hypothetical protein
LYREIKDLSQLDKYYFLKDLLNASNFNFDTNYIIKKVFEDVFNYYQNRSKWGNLFKARDDIIKLNSTFKFEHIIKDNHLESVTVNETNELKSILKNMSKLVKNMEENENISIFE